MKQCKNCLTINNQEVEKCTHCSMKDNFQDVEASSKPVSAVKKIYPSCSNCGTIESGDGARCQVCHFPIPQSKVAVKEAQRKNA